MMKRLLTILCIPAVLLLGSTEGWSLPPCESSDSSTWNNCFGIAISPDGGIKYVGEFKDGKWHGQGTATYADGDKYVGEHKDGKLHGQGTYTTAGGTVKKGTWRDGEFLFVADRQKGMEAYNAGDYAAALRKFRPLAEQGDAEAQYNLSRMYSNGHGVPKDDAQEVKWCRKAAEQGYADAQGSLGFMYQYGMGVTRDEAQAAAWYRKAAEQGDASSQAILSTMYSNGTGVPKDDAQALEWTRKAAEQGLDYTQHTLGFMYATGQGVAQDDVQAYMWFSLAVAQGMAGFVAERRDVLAESMTPDQIAEGQRLASEWMEKHRK